MKTISYIVLIAGIFYGSWAVSSECLLHDPAKQCGEFTLNTLTPILNHIEKYQDRWTACEDTKLEDNKAGLVKIDSQLANLQEKLTKLENRLDEKERIPQTFEKIGEKYYHIEDEKEQNWFSAEMSCRRMGGHLASIHSDEELDAIKTKLLKDRYWIDITDLSEEGNYLSATSTFAAPFRKWGNHEPNNHNGNENCVELSSYIGFLMNDVPCTMKANFICQYDAKNNEEIANEQAHEIGFETTTYEYDTNTYVTFDFE